MHPSSGTDSSPEVSAPVRSLPAVPWQISLPDGRQNSPYKVVPRYIPRLTAGRRHSPQCFSPPADILPENAWRKPLSCQKLPFPDFLSYMLIYLLVQTFVTVCTQPDRHIIHTVILLFLVLQFFQNLVF